MAILSYAMFGAAFVASVWTIWATIAPQFSPIVDLLTNGPVATPTLPAPVPARSNLRNVRVQGVAASPRSPQRAVA
ncbi:hypothetical protein [uncultured Sphingomonas sp.]|uniref:hypothetical protein n=1 Tax=uncultured Sphingomonas sp. TaxID=158754 RepID=UPI0025F74401|nr:hypothetical protein [uncultured Sphingomonas sp.]